MSSELATNLVGTRLGEYDIISRIGFGGMGVVYEGKHPLIGKRVAVKVLLPALLNEPGLVERFLAEARAVNEIRHRGIVDIFSFGQLSDGAHYFVMEFLEGEGFEKLIKSRAPLGIGQTLEWMEEVLDALDAAHQAGIIHRDIKPSNLFLVDTGRGRPYVKLLDFGIAKLGATVGESTPQTRASVIIGTPDYMSPEQAKGRYISPATDLYAIGCVLFEMLTASRLFKGDNALQTMWAHVESEPPVPSSLNPRIPAALDEVILWALRKAPGDRPSSAEELREHLASIRASLPEGLRAQTLPPVSGGARILGSTPPPVPGVQRATPSPSGQQPAVQPAGGEVPVRRSGSSERVQAPAPDFTNPSAVLGAHKIEDTKLSPLNALDGVPAAEGNAPRRPSVSRAKAKLPSGESRRPQWTERARSYLLPGVVMVLMVGGFAVGYFLWAQPSPVDANRPSEVEPKGPVAQPSNPSTTTTAALPAPTPTPPPAVDPALPAVKPEAEVPGNVELPGASEKPPVTSTAAAVREAGGDHAKAPVGPNRVASTATAKYSKPKSSESSGEAKDRRGITAAQLEARLSRIEAKLAAKEVRKGDHDRVLRQFIDQARRDAKTAQTDQQRREVWRLLDDIAQQLGP